MTSNTLLRVDHSSVAIHPIKSPRKLIEVALPLDAINVAAAKEKSIRHGHPSTLHLWWARRPLAAARAVIFAQLVNDPGYQQGGGFKYGKNKKEAAIERKRLFKIIEDLVLWENTNNEAVLEAARAEIRRSWREVCDLNKDHPQAAELFNPDKLPALHDPFAGGGAIPLEAQRLGLEAYASDLNPVAVLINKAMIEIPPKFAGCTPVGPASLDKCDPRLDLPKVWHGATGLAEDVRRYGAWMRAEAQKRIGHLYPPVEITPEMARERPDLKPLVGQKLTVIAWLWARTVKSPNPAFSSVDVPLVSSFILSSKAGKEVYVQPVVDGNCYRFTIKLGTPPPEADFRCILSDAAIEPS
jgi:putative DNA methylase